MKSVLIFGGSQGIGKLISMHFVAQGYPVSVASRSSNVLDEMKAEVIEKGLSINTVVADICDVNQIEHVFLVHKQLFGESPDIVINAAGILGPIGATWTLPPDEWEATLRVNLLGSFLVTRSAIEGMMTKGSGSIIHFSGGGAAYARLNFSAYAVPKTGLLRLVETVADELKVIGYDGIIINAIAPGAVRTRLTYQTLEAGQRAGAKAISEAEQVIHSAGTPPEQIISLVEFLCHPEKNRGISGRLIHVRENYSEFVDRFKGAFPDENGKLRRVPL